MTKVYLAVDPGGTTGLAEFNNLGCFVSKEKIKGHDSFLDEFESRLEAYMEIKVAPTVIYEKYLIRPQQGRPGANTWSDGPTLRLIGALERYCRKNKVEHHAQNPSPALIQGLKFLGLHEHYYGKTKRHVPDDVSAMAHGEYWIRKNGVRK